MNDSREDRGLWWLKCYPVEGDTAVAELWAGDEMWADLRLEGIQLDALGDARLAGTKVMLSLFGPTKKSKFAPGGTQWELDAVEALKQLEQARAWLLENERGRVPLPE